MISNTRLFTVGSFKFHLHHLLIIGILAISFSISFMIRSQAADYGFELNEFDPFFNYRATKYLVENGIDSYVNWHDDMSWHPEGRDVFKTSQVALHFTAAFLYNMFGAGTSLYDFTIIFPVVFGSLTAIVIFALVRVIGGTTAGLFASLFFALSPSIIVRGTIGWFKSEPLGLFYGFLAVYLFLSGLKSENKKIAFGKLVGAGLFLAIGFASWGGIQFLLMPIGLFIIALPFVRKDHKFLLWAIPLFVVTTMLVSMVFERPGIHFVTGIGGFALIGPTIFLIILIFINKFSKEKSLRNSVIFLVGSIVAGIAIILSNIFSLPSFRYLNAINPFLTTQNALVDSVAEHATPTLTQTFSFMSVLLLFAGLGIWLIFRKPTENQNSSINIKNEMTIFAVIIGLLGIYAGATFARLELFSSISIIILSSIALSTITYEILKRDVVQGKKSIIHSSGKIIKISYTAAIVALLLVPTVFPADANWTSITKAPPTILNGGSNFAMVTNDWPATLDWIKNNTPKDAVIASWWDYGYWITTVSERKTLADNATIDTERITKIAKMFLSPPDQGWDILQKLDADYVVVYVVGQKFISNDQELYALGGGGDESKKQWFMRIAGENISKFVEDDGFTPKNYFWENTLLGKMFPFAPLVYVDLKENLQSETYQSGYTGIYTKVIKYKSDDNSPLKLVYSSPTFDRKDAGVISGVLVYEVNHNYIQSETIQTNSQEESNTESTGEYAVLTTKFGDIVIAFRDDVAPQTAANFKKLANSGFYDGTIFHRIVPGFVIQGGDPNTISGSRETWGTGDPGYKIPPEFSDLKHTKYVVSMARGSDINSAGSQFFIMLGDAPWLDGQYTIFGEITEGKDVVDKIASLETELVNNVPQPVNPDDARISKIVIMPLE